MKFDKTIVIVFALGAALIIGWPHICRKMGWIPAKAPQQETVERTGKAVPQEGKTITETKDSVAENNSAKQVVQQADIPIADAELLKKYPAVVIGNDFLELSISPASGSVTSTALRKFRKHDLKNNILIGADAPRGALGLFFDKENKVAEIVESKMLNSNCYLLKRRIATGDGVVMLTQQWTLNKSYQVDCVVTIKNLSPENINLKQIAVSGYALPTLNQLTGDTIRRETHGIDYLTSDNNFDSLDADDDKLMVETNSPIVWFGAGNKYFAGIIKTEEPFDELICDRTKQKKNNEDFFTVMGNGVYNQISLPGHGERNFLFTAFCGPKEYSLLNDFAPQGENMLHLSWGPLDTIAGWLLRFLVWLHAKCGSYGWSIIILTMIVRMLFWPITQKANKSMKKMQQLQPLVAELKSKYKDNPQLMNSKVMELYREKHVSPLGGCLPILLQIPVFFALYATLDGAVELRQASFMWASDLSRPDTIANVFGLAINPLVISMTLLMVIQQRLTPMSGDPMQKKMMMFMPLIMLIFLYSLPSGLTLYWTVSQFFSILQLLITQKLDGKDNAATAVAKKIS